MTKHGNRIPSLDSGQVRDQLVEESDGKAIKRLAAAREYMAGHSPAEIETKYGWHEQTVYGWLNRFEERDFEDALYDDKPPGRSPELSDAQFQQFAETLHDPPEEAGYNEPAWDAPLVQEYLLKTFGVAHSQRHVSRLMNEADMTYKKPRPQPTTADEQEREEFYETVEDRIGNRDEDAVVVTIDQLRKTVGADLTYAWFPIYERRRLMCQPHARESIFSGRSPNTARRCFWSVMARSPRESQFGSFERCRKSSVGTSS